MKFLGKELNESNKGYFGVRRCTICNSELRDVNLVEIYATNYVCFIPVRKTLIKRILVCQHCKAYMDIDTKLWEYYLSYYHTRFNKTKTDEIINTLKTISNSMSEKEIKLNIDDGASQQSLDFIYDALCKKYNSPENIEEIVSVFFKN